MSYFVFFRRLFYRPISLLLAYSSFSFSSIILFPYFSYLIPSWIYHFYLANVPSFYRTPLSWNLSYLYYFEQQRGVIFPNYFIQIYLANYPYQVIKHSSFLLLTPFSSTTKRSLQPHDDKLLIGSQQSLIIVHLVCFSLDLLDFSFRTAVFISGLVIIDTLVFIVEQH